MTRSLSPVNVARTDQITAYLADQAPLPASTGQIIARAARLRHHGQPTAQPARRPRGDREVAGQPGPAVVPVAVVAVMTTTRAGKQKRRAFGPVQVLEHTGLAGWQWDAGTAAGLIPPPDVGGRRWSRVVADDVAARREAIVAAVGTDAPVGGLVVKLARYPRDQRCSHEME